MVKFEKFFKFYEKAINYIKHIKINGIDSRVTNKYNIEFNIFKKRIMDVHKRCTIIFIFV